MIRQPALKVYPSSPPQVKCLAGVKTESVLRVAKVAIVVAGEGGTIEAQALQALTGYSRPTVLRACQRLVRLGILTPVARPARGRGHKAAYRVVFGESPKRSRVSRRAHSESRFQSDQNPENVNPLRPPEYKNIKTHPEDAPASRGVQSLRDEKPFPSPRRQTWDFSDSEAQRVTLIVGARFYRSVMRSIRLGLEQWALSEAHRDALEGFYGLRIDGASLHYARQLTRQIWAFKCEIEALAAQGAPPRRVISFIAGRLAGVPEKRSKREVLRRTAALINDVELLERRIAGLKAWLREREGEYFAGRVCARCGYVHSQNEYQSGCREDGTGLVCFGFARVKLDELREMLKLQRRIETCRQCGGSLRGGHVEGLCWSCWERARGLTSRVFLEKID